MGCVYYRLLFSNFQFEMYLIIWISLKTAGKLQLYSNSPQGSYLCIRNSLFSLINWYPFVSSFFPSLGISFITFLVKFNDNILEGKALNIVYQVTSLSKILNNCNLFIVQMFLISWMKQTKFRRNNMA